MSTRSKKIDDSLRGPRPTLHMKGIRAGKKVPKNMTEYTKHSASSGRVNLNHFSHQLHTRPPTPPPPTETKAYGFHGKAAKQATVPTAATDPYTVADNFVSAMQAAENPSTRARILNAIVLAHTNDASVVDTVAVSQLTSREPLTLVTTYIASPQALEHDAACSVLHLLASQPSLARGIFTHPGLLLALVHSTGPSHTTLTHAIAILHLLTANLSNRVDAFKKPRVMELLCGAMKGENGERETAARAISYLSQVPSCARELYTRPDFAATLTTGLATFAGNLLVSLTMIARGVSGNAENQRDMFEVEGMVGGLTGVVEGDAEGAARENALVALQNVLVGEHSPGYQVIVDEMPQVVTMLLNAEKTSTGKSLKITKVVIKILFGDAAQATQSLHDARSKAKRSSTLKESEQIRLDREERAEKASRQKVDKVVIAQEEEENTPPVDAREERAAEARAKARERAEKEKARKELANLDRERRADAARDVLQKASKLQAQQAANAVSLQRKAALAQVAAEKVAKEKAQEKQEKAYTAKQEAIMKAAELRKTEERLEEMERQRRVRREAVEHEVEIRNAREWEERCAVIPSSASSSFDSPPRPVYQTPKSVTPSSLDICTPSDTPPNVPSTISVPSATMLSSATMEDSSGSLGIIMELVEEERRVEERRLLIQRAKEQEEGHRVPPPPQATPAFGPRSSPTSPLSASSIGTPQPVPFAQFEQCYNAMAGAVSSAPVIAKVSAVERELGIVVVGTVGDRIRRVVRVAPGAVGVAHLNAMYSAIYGAMNGTFLSRVARIETDFGLTGRGSLAERILVVGQHM